MNAIIAVLSIIAIVVLVRGFVFFIGRAVQLRQENAIELAYMKRWSTWAEQTKIDH